MNLVILELLNQLVKNFIKINTSFYTLIISLIAASLVIEPKSKYFLRFHKLNIFLIGICVIIISQLSLKFFLNSINLTYIILILPIILVFIYYFVLLIFTKFKLGYL